MGKRKDPLSLAELPDVITVPEMARVLKISKNSAYWLVYSGQMPHVRIGRAIRISKRALERYLGIEDEQRPSIDSRAVGFDISPLR